jgi:hypothetical protein
MERLGYWRRQINKTECLRFACNPGECQKNAQARVFCSPGRDDDGADF